MGYASNEGKAWAIERLRALPATPSVFIDLGAGAGSWLEAVKPWFLQSSWIAYEVWVPYIDRFCLNDRYDLVLPADIRGGGYMQGDVVIMGDILEHMSLEEAQAVWQRARESARVAVILSIPTVHYEQGHVHDNPYQEHITPDWTAEKVLDTFDGIEDHTNGKTVGTFWAGGLAES